MNIVIVTATHIAPRMRDAITVEIEQAFSHKENRKREVEGTFKRLAEPEMILTRDWRREKVNETCVC